MNLAGKRGRTPKKVKNLRRFTEQWSEFTEDMEGLTQFDEDDLIQVEDILHLESYPLNKYNTMANAMGEEM